MTIRVVLADDHAVVRDGLRALLDAQPDIEVVGDAGSGVEAIKLVAKLQPHVVVMDIAMPELNGILASQEIMQLQPKTKIIILSMHSTSEHITRALQAGACGYLLKESAGSEVVDAVRTVQADQFFLSQKILEKVLINIGAQDQASRMQNPLDRLSPREREVLQLVVEGRSNVVIGNLLSLSTKTVETYRSRLMKKLGINNMPDLVKFAIKHGIIVLE